MIRGDEQVKVSGCIAVCLLATTVIVLSTAGAVANAGTNGPQEHTYVTATYGSPVIDGEIDDCWKHAEVIVPKVYRPVSNVTAKHRLMWDENALYVLSEIYDSNLDASNETPYLQDSLEVFMDELHDGGQAYKPDDVHYRVNFNNMRTYDAGEDTRFYSATKLMTDDSGAIEGYVVEACITWDRATPANGVEIGIDLMVNEAANGTRISEINIFDTTGNAYQNPSLFGKLVLTGKEGDAVAGANRYPLLAYIEKVKGLYLPAYVNRDIVDEPLANAEKIAASANPSQSEIDDAYNKLKQAVDSLDDGSGYVKPSALPLVTEQPDAFTFMDGSRVTTLIDWERRRQEIAGLYKYYMYGVLPDTSGERVSTEYLDSYERYTWWGQKVTVTVGPNLKILKVNVASGDKTVSFVATVTLPAQRAFDPDVGAEVVTGVVPPTYEDGYPVLIVIGFLGEAEKRYLNDHGYAVIEYDNNTIAADNASRTGVFYELYPYGKTWDTQTGVLLAWSWGVSKIIDAIENDARGARELNISPVNTIVTGVSRNGKAAAVAGAFEPRIKVTVPASSGAGGMANFRYQSSGRQYDYSMLEKHEFIDFLGEEQGTALWQQFQDNPIHTVGANESLSNLQSQSEAHWFNDKFLEFTSPYQLPFDQQFLVALTATPDRYYLITGEIHGGDWINPAGMYVTYLAARNIFESLGLANNIGIHLHATGHALTLEDVKYLVEFCDWHFYGIARGNKDLEQLKTSIFELPVNYDPCFDEIKNARGPNLIISW